MAVEAATALRPLFVALMGDDLPLAVTFWDGSALGPPDAPARAVVRSPRALRRVLYAPNELGFGRAFVEGEIAFEGDAYEALRAVTRAAPDDLRVGVRALLGTMAGAARLGILGRPLRPPPEEARLRGVLHSKARDAAAVSHHYDLSNDFYRIVLGQSLTYSCARFTRPGETLEEAQAAKYELVCRKLGLEPGKRLLDVGCGWGGMLLHAAEHHGVEGVGVTLSEPQRQLASQRIVEAGLGGRLEVRLQDYRDLAGEGFDAISSIGMFEHVGKARMAEYFAVLFDLLRPHGRLLNHAISTPDGASFDRRSFLARYVFPDGELQDVSVVASAMQAAGFEIRDVESLREHYAETLRHWVANLEARWEEAVNLVGERRARVWWLYMVGSAVGFEEGEISVHQVLGVRAGPDGSSAMPRTRASLL